MLFFLMLTGCFFVLMHAGDEVDYFQLPTEQMTIKSLSKVLARPVTTPKVTLDDIKKILPRDAICIVASTDEPIPSDNAEKFLVHWLNFPAQEADRKHVLAWTRPQLNQRAEVPYDKIQNYVRTLLINNIGVVRSWQ